MNNLDSLRTYEDELDRITDFKRILRSVFLIFGLGFGGFLLWAFLAPLDEGVPASGVVAIESKRYSIQHTSGGTVKRVLVGEGDVVSKGQLLLELSDAQLASSARVLGSELSGLNEGLNGQRASLRGIERSLPSREGQVRSLEEELERLSALVLEGYAPLNQRAELERRVVESRSVLDELRTQKERVKSTISELEYKIMSTEQRLSFARSELDNLKIFSPDHGQVIGLRFANIGAVIQPAEKIMDLVPSEAEFVIEARIPPHLVDRVSPGNAVDLIFTSFSNAPQLVIAGELVSISNDILQESANSSPYFLARVTLSEGGFATLGRRKLQAGMPLQVVVKTGERSFIDYLLAPLVRRVSQSLKEE